MENQEKKLYQLTCLFKVSTDSEKINKAIEEIKKIASSESDSEKNYSSEPARRRISYQIKKEIEAIYWDFFFYASPDMVKKIEKNLRMKDSLLRFILFKKKEIKAKPKLDKKDIDFKIIDKIEPLSKKKIEETIKEIPEEIPKKEEDKTKEKTKIEDLDKKLEEILNQ